MAHLANDVPNAQSQRLAPGREESLDDISKLAPELNREYLTVEPSAVATGGFSDIFFGRWAPPEHPEGIDVAVKVLRMPPGSTDLATTSQNIRYGKLLGREIFVWQRATAHPRITPLIGYIRKYKDDIVPCIVTKRRQENLLAYLTLNPEADRFKLLYQVLEGLIFLHTFEPDPIIHLDIKPGNILVTQDGDAELCDFGYAKVLGTVPSGFTTGSNPGGTYPYMSPEVVSGAMWEELTPRADIFAIGSTILYVLSGKKPWYSLRGRGRLTLAVMNGTPPPRKEYPMDGSKEAINLLWDLLVRCWSQEPEDRPSAQEVLDKLRDIEAIGGVRPPTQTTVGAADPTV